MVEQHRGVGLAEHEGGDLGVEAGARAQLGDVVGLARKRTSNTRSAKLGRPVLKPNDMSTRWSTEVAL